MAVEEIEVQFWQLMSGCTPRGVALYAARLRMEARRYQQHVAAQQFAPPTAPPRTHRGGVEANMHAPGGRVRLVP